MLILYNLQIDEDTYPELYRKTEYVKGSNDTCPEPFRIACIEEIFYKTTLNSKMVNVSEVKLKVRKFYRCVLITSGLQSF